MTKTKDELTTQPDNTLDELAKSIELIIDHAEQNADTDHGMFSDMDNNPMNRQTIMRDVLALIKKSNLALLTRLEAEKKIYVKHAEYVTELNEPPLVVTTDYKYMIDLTSLQSERALIEKRMM